MQTLNVGAGRTDSEYKAAEQQRCADLRDESLNDANYFFWAAGLAALGTGLLPVRVNILVGVGALDLLTFYGTSPSGRSLGWVYPLIVYGASAIWVMGLVALGFAARRGKQWAFLAGVILYGADMMLLIGTFSLWAFGVHSFFVFKWFHGQRALKELNEAEASA